MRRRGFVISKCGIDGKGEYLASENVAGYKYSREDEIDFTNGPCTSPEVKCVSDVWIRGEPGNFDDDVYSEFRPPGLSEALYIEASDPRDRLGGTC